MQEKNSEGGWYSDTPIPTLTISSLKILSEGLILIFSTSILKHASTA